MTDGSDLVALFYRADWTRLSLSAEVHEVTYRSLRLRIGTPVHQPGFMRIGEFPPMEPNRYEYRARLRVAPGGRYRVDILPVRSEADDPGDRARVLRTRYGTRPGMPPPYPELLQPSSLLNAHSLELAERVEVAGRPVLRVIATPAPGVWRASKYTRPERVEVIADAETGILLRCEEFFDGQTLRFAQFTDLTFEPADEFWIPGGAEDDGEPPAESSPLFTGASFSGPGWTTAKTAVNAFKTAANAVGPVLGPAIRHAPRRPGGAADDDREAEMPLAGERFDPAISGSPASDEVLRALFRSGRAAFTATLHEWVDLVALGEQARTWTSDHGWGGIGAIARAFSDRVGTVHQVTRVSLAGDGRYRLEFLRDRRKYRPRVIVCDGTRRWREYDDRVIIGPALPLEQYSTNGREIARMVDTAVLLASHVTNVAETEVGGRRGFALRVAEGPYHDTTQQWLALPLGGRQRDHSLQDSDLVVDAELGIMLRMICYAGDKQASLLEFRDVALLPADGGEFAMDVPPGIRVEEFDGGMLDELDMPHAMRFAIRSSASAAKAAESAAKAARDFLNSLRGPRR
jgi:outer membrane lipoprotein-sorting protein